MSNLEVCNMNRHLEEADTLLTETAQELNRLMDINPEVFLESGISKDRIIRNLALARMIVEDANEDLQLFEEKASTFQYRLSKFKQKYQYNPQKKTITVDGDTYKCDLSNVKSGTADLTVNGMKCGKMIRSLHAQTKVDDPEIILDENFFKLKNPKRSDAMLQHEIGHTKYHNMASGNQHVAPSGVSLGYYMDTLKDEYKAYSTVLAGISSKEDIYDRVKDQLPPKDEYLSKASKDQVRKDIRKEMIKIAKKYEKLDTTGGHANFKEFEADRYAANKTSKKAVKTAIRDYEKHNSKSMPKTIKATKRMVYDDSPVTTDEVKERRKVSNKMNADDYKTRSKALNDKDLATSKIYK